MPRSPLTWFIAFTIVLFHAVALFLQRKGDLPVMGSASGATFVLSALLGWSATRDAPPFSDRAFHRTLPAGDGAAFWSVLAIHLLVLAGITMATAVYCLYFNFGWTSVGRGIVLVTLPLGVFMTIFCTSAAIATSQGKARFLGFPAVLGGPLISLWVAVPLAVTLRAEPHEASEKAVLEGAVIAAIFYFAIWWLVSVRHRKTFGMLAGLVFGLWLPWIPGISEQIGFFRRDLAPQMAATDPMEAPVNWRRKVFSDPAGDWIPVSQVLDVTGLKQGEVARMKYLWVGGGSERAHVWELVVPWGVQSSLDASVSKDGSVQWGRTALVESLRAQLPPLNHIRQLHPDREPNDPLALVFKKPNNEPASKGTSWRSTKYTLAEFRDERWRAEVEAFRYDLAGIMNLPLGGSCRVPLGGRIFADIVKGEGPIPDSIVVRYCIATSTGSRGWISRGQDAPPAMMVVIDGNGEQAYAAELVSDQSYWGGLWLGLVHRWSFQLTGRNAGLIQTLEGGRVYFFLPSEISQPRSEILPPPSADPR